LISVFSTVLKRMKLQNRSVQNWNSLLCHESIFTQAFIDFYSNFNCY
jgi:hypothetical protein